MTELPPSQLTTVVIIRWRVYLFADSDTINPAISVV
jgi:hypothetical protein